MTRHLKRAVRAITSPNIVVIAVMALAHVAVVVMVSP